MLSLEVFNSLCQRRPVITVTSVTVMAQFFKHVLQMFDVFPARAGAHLTDEVLSLLISAFLTDAAALAGFRKGRFPQDFPLAEHMLQAGDRLRPGNAVGFQAVPSLRLFYGFPCLSSVFAVLRG